MLYSLPTIYKEPLLKTVNQPVLFDALTQNNVESTLTVVQKNEELPAYLNEYKALFNETSIHQDISKLIFSNKLNEVQSGLHIVYFNFEDTYQFELFTDALLLAQKKKLAKDNIWISSVGNPNPQEGLKTKQAMYISSNDDDKNKTVKMLTSHMDIQSTLIKQWLKCDIAEIKFGNGADITTLKKDRVIANTNDAGLVVFDKDQSVFIDQNGNFQSFSGQLNAPITINEDFPLLIDGVHFIKQFSDNSQVIE
jgi:membrane-anchored protein YejM (alkaline phosphatase superfamily)